MSSSRERATDVCLIDPPRETASARISHRVSSMRFRPRGQNPSSKTWAVHKVKPVFTRQVLLATLDSAIRATATNREVTVRGRLEVGNGVPRCATGLHIRRGHIVQNERA